MTKLTRREREIVLRAAERIASYKCEFVDTALGHDWTLCDKFWEFYLDDNVWPQHVSHREQRELRVLMLLTFAEVAGGES